MAQQRLQRGGDIAWLYHATGIQHKREGPQYTARMIGVKGGGGEQRAIDVPNTIS